MAAAHINTKTNKHPITGASSADSNSESELELAYGSLEWLVRDTLKRNHGAKDCPHLGTCLNDDQATARILEAVTQQLEAKGAEGRVRENLYWIGYHLDSGPAELHRKRIAALTNNKTTSHEQEESL